MHKSEKKMAKEFLSTLSTAHYKVGKYLECGNLDQAHSLLSQCQQGAVELGNLIEATENGNIPTIGILEDYCELLYQIDKSIRIHGKDVDAYKKLKMMLRKVERSLETDVAVRREIVFLPYKASMWDSLESIWQAAVEDKNVDVYVIPIPYYERTSDGGLGILHDEKDQYPSYVPITARDSYDFTQREPDAIFIHNPYDEDNQITCVPPFFFSENLKKYTKKLVYIPYFVLPGAAAAHVVLTRGLIHSDLVFVQSEPVKKQYMKILEEYSTPKNYLRVFDKKIVALGSPKTDKVLKEVRNPANIPEEWEQKIRGRKVIFFNTNVSLILNNGEYFTENLYRIFHICEKYRDKYVLLWREHPLTSETIAAMRPQILESYLRVKKNFVEKDWGILDTTPEAHLAIALSDCYYGAAGSLIAMYAVTGKPMLLANYHYPQDVSRFSLSKDEFLTSLGKRYCYREKNVNALALFLENLDEIDAFAEYRMEKISKHFANLDGTAGSKIYQHVMNELEE